MPGGGIGSSLGVSPKQPGSQAFPVCLEELSSLITISLSSRNWAMTGVWLSL